jgi:hypothetical protein
MAARQSQAEEGSARFEYSIVPQPKDVMFRVAITGHMGKVLSQGWLRSPENEFEVVEDYPHPYVCLDGIFTALRFRGKGYASRVVRLLLDEASRQGWAVLCRPMPYGRGKYPLARLFEYYKMLGWRADPYDLINDNWLVWLPGQKPRLQGAYIP